MGSFEMWITREGEDESTDYKVMIEFTQDAYGVEVWMSDEEAKLFGQLTESEKQRAIHYVQNEDWD